MILRTLTAIMALMPFASGLQAGWFDNITSYFQQTRSKPPSVKVLIVHDQPGAMLEVKGKYKIYDPHTKEHISTRFVGKRKYIQAVRDGIKWGEEFPGVHQLLIIPDERTTTTLIDGVEYRGPVYVYDVDGAISIVNETGIEDYLSATLPQAYRDPLPDEALAAIAIAARTSAYYQAENPKSKYWDADGRKIGYQGYTATRQPSSMERAIRTTRYMVMTEASAKDGEVGAFIVDWKLSGQPKSAVQAVTSQITLGQVEEMAKQGEHAAQILSKAFPGTRIVLIRNPAE